MATYTTNINLKKPAQSDKIRIADFNNNADNIDAAVGAGFGQGTNPSINQSINNLADGLAILATGNVHAAISAGQFVYVRGHGTLTEGLYVANQAISANGTLSNSNLDADASGGLNALKSKMATKILTITPASGITMAWKYAIEKCGIVLMMVDVTGISIEAWGTLAIGSVNTMFSQTVFTPAIAVNGEGENVRAEISTNGTITLRNWNNTAISDKEIIFNAVNFTND